MELGGEMELGLELAAELGQQELGLELAAELGQQELELGGELGQQGALPAIPARIEDMTDRALAEEWVRLEKKVREAKSAEEEVGPQNRKARMEKEIARGRTRTKGSGVAMGAAVADMREADGQAAAVPPVVSEQRGALAKALATAGSGGSSSSGRKAGGRGAGVVATAVAGKEPGKGRGQRPRSTSS